MIYCIKFIYLYINQLSSSWSWDRLAFHLRFTSSSLSFVVTGGRERRRGLVSEVFSGVAMGVAGTPQRGPRIRYHRSGAPKETPPYWILRLYPYISLMYTVEGFSGERGGAAFMRGGGSLQRSPGDGPWFE